MEQNELEDFLEHLFSSNSIPEEDRNKIASDLLGAASLRASNKLTENLSEAEKEKLSEMKQEELRVHLENKFPEEMRRIAMKQAFAEVIEKFLEKI
jgi:methionyl-tRNA formyltransferase